MEQKQRSSTYIIFLDVHNKHKNHRKKRVCLETCIGGGKDDTGDGECRSGKPTRASPPPVFPLIEHLRPHQPPDNVIAMPLPACCHTTFVPTFHLHVASQHNIYLS
jgi:hypothetical protein